MFGVSNQVRNPGFQVRNPSFQVRNPSFQVRNPGCQMSNPGFQVSNSGFQVSNSGLWSVTRDISNNRQNILIGCDLLTVTTITDTVLNFSNPGCWSLTLVCTYLTLDCGV